MQILQEMKFYKLALFEAWFNKGYGVTAPLKYLVALFGVANAIATENILLTMIAGMGYVIFCFIFGAFLYHIGYVEAEAEVGNVYNPFAKQLRGKFKLKEKTKDI